jgi:ubiquinone/menaquinone biosynthesis C-methylase UbiE
MMMKHIDYKFDPIYYEIEEKARPDEMLLYEELGIIGNEILNNTENANILDLCCGTGLSIEKFVNHKNVKKIVGVDNCVSYLDYAKEKYKDIQCVNFILDDAVNVELPNNEWDIIVLSSAYHHIEDNRKLAFLLKVQNLLSPRGVILLAENILPEYDNSKEGYVNAVKLFYEEVLKTAKLNNSFMSEEVVSLIWKVAQYGFDGEYEYKTSFSIFQDYINNTLLQIDFIKKVWPKDNTLLSINGGNYVMKITTN